MRYLILILLISGCSVDHEVSDSVQTITDSTHTVVVVNPVIEYCERLYPEILNPDEFSRETLITECMIVCSEGGCGIDPAVLDDLLEGL